MHPSGCHTAPPETSSPQGPHPGWLPVDDEGRAVQAEVPLLPLEPTWDELRDGLVNARALDLATTRARAEVFEALEPHPEVAYWRRLAAAKREEADHLVAWRAERRARIQRERQAEEAQHRVTTERAMEETRNRRLAEEADLQAVRARWEAARRDEEKAAAELGLVGERPQRSQPNPPGAGRTRHCFVCRWPGVRVPRRCQNAHPPETDAPPRG